MNFLDGIELSAGPWGWACGVLGTTALVALAASYARGPGSGAVRGVAFTCKLIGIAAVLLFLLDPQRVGTRPRPDANLVLLLADDSQSMQIQDASGDAARVTVANELLSADSDWLIRLEQDFDVRRYAHAGRLRTLWDDDRLTGEGTGSDLATALSTLGERFRDRPVAAVVLLSDGLSTTPLDALDLTEFPPIYPLLLGSEDPTEDLALGAVGVRQTAFERNPVTVQAEILASGVAGRRLEVELLDEAGALVTAQSLRAPADGEPASVRLQTKPEEGAVAFHRLRVRDPSVTDPEGGEATLLNNERWIHVRRGAGPYRILYVSGRPNWEFKFLNRALEDDAELQLVGLLRIARREPKFTFRDEDRRGSRSQLFQGFETSTDEGAEQYDEPVLLRIGTLDEYELREGFPRTAEDLFGYHAIVLDDLEAAFFTADQQTLIRDFVSKRGGGLLLLGGQESFGNGGYAQTPLEDLAPVYLDSFEERHLQGEIALELTREGWLQPWIRLRATEPLELERLGEMPAFWTLNLTGAVKPGASELWSVTDSSGEAYPALVTQRFSKGRTAAMLLGDLWRWGLRRKDQASDDLGQAWRQSLRWMVADVPGRVRVEVTPRPERGPTVVELAVHVLDEAHRPLDNATVRAKIRAPGGEELDLVATPGDAAAGSYRLETLSGETGPYRATVTALARDGTPIAAEEIGWVANLAEQEFRRIAADGARLRGLAERTGGKVLRPAQIGALPGWIAAGEAPVTERHVVPLWHRWWTLAIAAFCLCAEWGLRRMRGLP